jgi:outer membrane receptor for ferrienterochelin and colicin
MNKQYILRGKFPRRTAIALALGMGISGLAFGQATTGSIFGDVPAGSGNTVLIQSASGFTRQVGVDASGHYSVTQLPVGTYTVTVQHDGQTVDSRSNVALRVGTATEVSFVGGTSAKARNLSAVTVTANALPAIDVTDVNSSTIITSQQLKTLPIAHNAEAIALLAPGAVRGSAYFGNYVSFGGSSVTENAYYINGFNTTDPLSGFGGMTLPYGSIDQQQMLTGGYGAEYGRSDGGVISQVGKSGTNEWHFGGQVRWLPRSLAGDPVNQYQPGGKLQNYNRDDGSWETQYSAYIGGPLIKDKLFLFAAAQYTKQEGSTVGAVSSANETIYAYHTPDYYLKLNWNINDSNILELTGARSSNSYAGQVYGYDNDTRTEGEFQSNQTQTKDTDKLWVAKFTSYITDDITLTAMYGKLKHGYYNHTPGYDPTYPHIFSPELENPAIIGGNYRNNTNVIGTFSDPKHQAENTNLRVDLSWVIGNHTLTAGIDNQTVQDIDDGSTTSGPGYAWEYNNSPNDDPTHWIVGGPDSGDPNWQNKLWVEPTGAYPGGSTGYYVAKYINTNSASVKVTQRAQYLQDDWQINDRWRLRVGLRNDQFTNYNPDGVAYLKLTSPQWSPRLGFTWDVNGDSSFKVYGNAGRYYLAMPASVALRSAGGSLYTRTYYTYTGIDENGIPTGLTPINTSRGVEAGISVNNEYGQPRDPKTATATNLTAEYQDEFIAGFDKQLNDSWVYGVKATYRKLRNGIDDVGDQFAIADKMVAMGLVNEAQAQDLISNAVIPASVLFNPNKTNVFRITNPNGGYYTVPMSMKDFGFNTSMKRSYLGLDMYLEHPFDGTWYGKVTYTLSHSYGNSEGQVRSDIGQSDVSATVDWDYAQTMDYANGDLANDRRHQIKAYGAYQFAPEWMVSGNLTVMSGMPRTCLGYYGPEQTNPGLGYGGYYHFCDGKPYSPGKQHNPWEYTLDLGVQYTPTWADKKLNFTLNVLNVFDRQSVRQTYPQYAGGNPYWPTFQDTPMPISWTAPRSVELSISYDY